MPNHIFISYGFNNTTAYYTVEKWLNDAMNHTAGFSWVSCSAPNDSGPDHADGHTDKMLMMNKIRNQIMSSAILIVVSDMYRENKKLIDFEIDTAKHSGKYIIALRRWRNLKPVPGKISKNADEIVNLSSPDLIGAVGRYCGITGTVSGSKPAAKKLFNTFDNTVKS